MAQRSLCHLDPFRGFWPVEKAYSLRANASRRLFHSKGEGPALGIADLFLHLLLFFVLQLLFVLRAMTLRMPRICAFQIAARVPNSNMCACACSKCSNAKFWRNSAADERESWRDCMCVCVCVSALFSHLAQLRGKQEIRATSASHGQQDVLLES